MFRQWRKRLAPATLLAVSSNSKPGPRWRRAIRGNVLMVGLVSLLTDLGSEMINPLLPLFVMGLVPLGWAPVYLGLAEGIAESTAGLLKLLSGRLTDKLGRSKPLVLLGYTLSSLCRPLMAIASAGGHVVAIKFADRIGKGLRTSPRDALISASVDPDVRGAAFSFHRAMDHLGAVLGPIAALLIFRGLGGDSHPAMTAPAAAPTPWEMTALRWVFAASALPGLAAVGVIILGLRDIAAGAVPTGRQGAASRARLPRSFYGFVAAVGLFALGNSSDLFLVLYGLERFAMPPSSLVGMWVALHISKVIFSVPGGALSDRIGRLPVVIAGWILYALVYWGMGAVSDEGQFWGLLAAYGAYYGLTEGAEKALVADLVPAHARGSAFGVYHAVVGIAVLPASLVFGLVWSKAGAPASFGLGAILAAAAVATLVMTVARSPRHPAA